MGPLFLLAALTLQVAAVDRSAETALVTSAGRVDAESELAAADQSALPEDRLAALEKIVADLQQKASKKSFPTLTVNGVFQADAGWIHQDSASEAAYGQIQDGADFRRARLSAKGLVTESTGYMLQMDFGFFGRPTFTDV